MVPFIKYKNSMLLSSFLFELGNAVLLVISKKEYIGDVMTSTHYSLLKSKGKMAGFQILFLTAGVNTAGTDAGKCFSQMMVRF